MRSGLTAAPALRIQDESPSGGQEGAPEEAPDLLSGEVIERTGEYLDAAWRWLSDDAPARVAWLLAAIALFIILRALRSIVSRIIRAPSQDDASVRNIVASLVGDTWTVFLFIISINVFTPMLDLPEPLADVLRSMVIIVGALQVAVWVSTLLTSLLVGFASRQTDDRSMLANATTLLRVFINGVVWAIAILFILSNVGVNVTALIAGLGVGGIAIGLAAQGIFSDLFASLSIVLDKPFVRGDFIIFGDLMGTVEKVGLKTTRIRALSGEQIVISNTNLLSEKIRNYQRLWERRIVFEFGVVYQTPLELLEQIPAWVREAVESTEGTRFDRSHFKTYGDSALVFETVWFSLTPDFNDYMDRQQAINLKVFARFKAEGVDFAHPTRTLYVASQDAPAGEARPAR